MTLSKKRYFVMNINTIIHICIFSRDWDKVTWEKQEVQWIIQENEKKKFFLHFRLEYFWLVEDVWWILSTHIFLVRGPLSRNHHCHIFADNFCVNKFDIYDGLDGTVNEFACHLAQKKTKFGTTHTSAMWNECQPE